MRGFLGATETEASFRTSRRTLTGNCLSVSKSVEQAKSSELTGALFGAMSLAGATLDPDPAAARFVRRHTFQLQITKTESVAENRGTSVRVLRTGLVCHQLH